MFHKTSLLAAFAAILFAITETTDSPEQMELGPSQLFVASRIDPHGPRANSALHRTWSRQLAASRVRCYFARGSKLVSLGPLAGAEETVALVRLI
jgi:hypothetical protein